MKWISVKDKLPEHFGSLLGFTKSKRTLITWIDKGTKTFDFHCIDDDDEFTHWMPLPEPPKE